MQSNYLLIFSVSSVSSVFTVLSVVNRPAARYSV